MKHYVLYSIILMFSASCMYGAKNIDERLQSKKIISQQLSKGFNENDLFALKKIFDENPKVLRVRLKKDNDTLVHLAVKRNRVEILELLLSYEGVSVNKQNVFGDTPAHLAATLGNIRCARILVQHGANLTKKNFLKATPMDYIRVPHFFD